MTPPEKPVAFWSYLDVLLVASLAFPALLLSILLSRLFSFAMPFGKPFQGLMAQLVWYILIFGALWLLLKIRYGASFWKSLGWRFPFRGVGSVLIGGPILTLALGVIGYLIRVPVIKPPFEEMMSNRPTLVLFGLFAVVLGPLSEELAFRGFLLPLVIRSAGVAGGIVLTGLLFGALHAYEYDWSWRHSLLIAIAGMVFGWVRYALHSTAASTFMHATFNLTQFAGLMAQSGQRW